MSEQGSDLAPLNQGTSTEQFAYVRDWGRVRDVKGWWHSFELPDGQLIDGVCGLADLKNRIAQFPIPADLRGKRVLDIGAWDGWFSFEMERRGATVVAVDCWDNPRFRQMHSWLQSRVDYRIYDIYELTPDKLGTFDIVLFLGVLYHLKHPLLALERVCSLTSGLAAVDSFVLPETISDIPELRGRSFMEFYETTEMGGQTDNWVGPNIPCLMAMSRAAGFARVEFLNRLAHSACLACYRNWPETDALVSARPVLLAACHHTSFGINCSALKDDYVTCRFSWPQGDVSVDLVRPRVGPYGIRPISITPADVDGEWHATFKVPPGLVPGWHNVSLQVGESAHSNNLRIAVDMNPECARPPEITGIADGETWTPGALDLTRGDIVAIWVRNLPENADFTNVEVVVGDRRAQIMYLTPANGADPRQVNIRLPNDVQTGEAGIVVRMGAVRSAPATLVVTKS